MTPAACDNTDKLGPVSIKAAKCHIFKYHTILIGCANCREIADAYFYIFVEVTIELLKLADFSGV